ncbi:MAG TPA: hypothetical protein VFL91_18925 [Thermomicrobiales bacterium]|nr:hypothetical protein [Thermomicrobiales bacterium]
MGNNTVSVYGGGYLERITTRPAAFGAPQPPRRTPQPKPEPATFGGGTPASGHPTPTPPGEGGAAKMSAERRAELLSLDPLGRAILAAEGGTAAMKGERGEVDDMIQRMVDDGIISKEEGDRRRQRAKRADGPMSAERRRELLQHTALGQRILREEAAAARKAGK